MAARKKTPTKKKVTRKKATRKKAPAKKSPPKKRAGGRPPFTPTDEQRTQVKILIGLGLTYREVASVILNPQTGSGISINTFQDRFREELEAARGVVKSRVAMSLFKKAISDNHPQAAICAMFIAKCQMGWRQEERVVHEVESSTGVLIAPAATSPQAWIEAQKDANAKKKKPE
jgi:hypothetical protein